MRTLIIPILFISTILFLGCVKAPSVPSAITTPSAIQAEVTKAEWEKDWQNLIQKAKKEASVILYLTMSPAARIPITEAFKDKYGITVNVVAGSGPSIITKLLSERKAGIYLADVYMGGSSTIISRLKPEDALSSLGTTFLLPEILNPDMWYEGKLPFLDSAHTIFTLTLAPSRPIWINTSRVQSSEIKSYQDLLNSKWKGQIMINDPTIMGMGHQWFSALGGILIGYDYMRELTKQDPILIRDTRQQAEWLARGKYSISIAVGWSSYEPFVEIGAPLQPINLSEGDFMTGADSNITLINKAPHPNAARLFVNWLTSKEGGTVMAKFYQKHSTRIDVPTEFEGKKLIQLREPGGKYYNIENEEFLLKSGERIEKAREIFGYLIK